MSLQKQVSKDDIDWLLHLHEEAPGIEAPKKRSSGVKKVLLRFLIGLFGLFALGILPFFLLIRSAVYFYESYAVNGWMALAMGVLAASLLLMFYLIAIFRSIQNKRRLIQYSFLTAGGMTLAFLLFALFTFSAINAKSDEVGEVFRSMHPILRVAVSTLTLADGDLVVTDILRTPGDYDEMGLPVYEESMHFTQTSGYVHAVDLRTIGRSEFRNVLLEISFQILGFQTLRHSGTADHLHVELAVYH